MARKQNPQTRSNLLDAALSVIRTKGYTATTVDDICTKASLSKGAFFHHFSSKEDLAVPPRTTGRKRQARSLPMPPIMLLKTRLSACWPMSSCGSSSFKANCLTSPVSSAP